MDVQLRHDVPDGGDVELVAPRHRPQHLPYQLNFVEQLTPVRRVEVDDLRDARPARHEHQPRVVCVTIDQQARKREVADRHGVGGKLRMQFPLGRPVRR